MPWRGGSAGRRSLFPWKVILAGLAALLLPAETLDLTVKQVVRAFLNNDTSLPCTISGYSTPELDIKKIAVTWYLKTTGRNDKKIYSVIAGDPFSYRSGAYLDTEKLKKGDATLSLPQIQLNENGTYICSVTVTPDKVDRTTVLEIVAKPDINLSPKILTIERDKEKTISCAVNKYYPDEIVVQWEKNSKHTADKSVPAEDICTGSSVKNEYGTFNVTSKLKLQPSLQDDGNIYSCIVKHKSFSLYPVHSVTLTVTEPRGNNIWIVWLVAIISFIIPMAIYFMAVYFNWFKKIPPTTMAFVGNDKLKHSEENHLECLFSGFRPMPLELNYFLIKPNKEKEKILSWNTKAASDPEQGDENLALLKKQEMFIFNQTLSKTKMRTSMVSSKVVIVPDVKKLPEFVLSVEIKHEALPQGLLVTTQSFQVISQPLLDSVQCSTDEPKPEEPLTLTCKITKYFPNEIETCWWKDDERVPEQPITESIKGSDGLFSCYSSIRFFPKTEDIGKTFFCKARLKSVKNLYRESGWTLNTLVFPPKVSHIKCEPSEPELGKPITLSCVVRDFYPPECDICWKKGLKKLTDSSSEVSELDPASRLYYRKSQVSFIPNPEDHGVDFVVEINHCNKITQNKYSLVLKGFPKVADISLDPSNPEYGRPLCLSCKVMNFYPRDIDIQWLDGDNLIMNGVDTEEPVVESNGCFHLTSRYQLKPTASDYNKSISIKVKHKKLAKPIAKSVYLNLPAKLPVLSEIKATRPSPWGKDITLEISISDFAPSDIRVTWYKEWKRLSEDTNLRTVLIGENKLCYMTSQITVDPKEEDIGKTIRCEVYHPATNRVQEKSFLLKSRVDSCDSTEKISPSHVNRNHIGPPRNSWPVNEELMNSVKIVCDTSSPTAGQKVTLHCFVPGKDADKADVFWYKGIYPVEEEIQNTNCEDGTGFISHVTVETKKGEKECEIRCEVSVGDENLEESYILKLS